jgi:hypothetical protein
MRHAILVMLLLFALLAAGCATAEKPSASGEKGTPPPAVKPYE